MNPIIQLTDEQVNTLGTVIGDRLAARLTPEHLKALGAGMGQGVYDTLQGLMDFKGSDYILKTLGTAIGEAIAQRR